MYKHFIRTNTSGEVIAAFSNAFQDPEAGDIMVAETDERHFNLQLVADGVPRFTWDGKHIVERTAAEIEAIAAPARERAAALGRLSELDAVIQRSVEDLYQATGTKPHAKVADAIAEKNSLRAKLK